MFNQTVYLYASKGIRGRRIWKLSWLNYPKREVLSSEFKPVTSGGKGKGQKGNSQKPTISILMPTLKDG